MKKKLFGGILLGLSLVLGCAFPAMADSRKVVTLGADLSQSQKDTMMKYFGVTYDSVDVIYIDNQDERDHLGSYVPLEQIGTRTYSCALVAPTTSGGIQVKTANLTWVTCNMIASTLSTSGVTNCQVVAASPFAVSGTGALTGVIMAYEQSTKAVLEPTKVDLANQELVCTGNLANEIGQSQATAVINETKIRVIENNITNIQEITNVINEVSVIYNVEINEDQSEEIAELMQQIAQQEYDIEQLEANLARVQANIAEDAGASQEEIEAAERRAEQTAQEALEAAQREAEQEGLETDAEDETEAAESILDNTDISALEEGGATVEEADTVTSVVEQAAETETETETDLYGIPAATDDGTIEITEAAQETESDSEAVLLPGDGAEQTEAVTETQAATNADGSEVLLPGDGAVTDTEATENNDGSETLLPGDGAEPDTEAAENTDGSETLLPGDGAATDTEASETEGTAATEEAPAEEMLDEDMLDTEDRITYSDVKEELKTLFENNQVTDEFGTVVYLTSEAADTTKDEIENYFLKVLIKGAAAVEAEEALDTDINQKIMADTKEQAEDKNYEDDEMKLIDKFLRRLFFEDKEEIFKDCELTDDDRILLYNEVIAIFEKAYEVEDLNAESDSDDFTSDDTSAEYSDSETLDAEFSYSENIEESAEGDSDFDTWTEETYSAEVGA